MIFFTLATLGYLPRVDVLARSLAEHHPGSRLIVVLVDRVAGRVDFSDRPLLDVREVERLDPPDFPARIARYRIAELATSMKAFAFRRLFDEFPAENVVVYLDPDTRIYAPMAEVESELEGGSVLLTPNILTPDPGTDPDQLMPDERLFLRAGIFNLGFMAARRCAETDRLLAWWDERLETRSLYQMDKGMYGDQLWMNHAPVFFRGVRSWRHFGANMGWRNLHERVLSRENGRWMVGDAPLVLYHFSRLPASESGPVVPGCRRFTFADRPDLVPLYAEYRRELEAAGQGALGTLPCLLPGLRPSTEPRPRDRRRRLKAALRKVLPDL